MNIDLGWLYVTIDSDVINFQLEDFRFFVLRLTLFLNPTWFDSFCATYLIDSKKPKRRNGGE